MKIVCSSLDDFLVHLDRGEVYDSTVYLERSRVPINGTSRSATSYEVYFQAAAILNIGEGQALLELGLCCGIDRETSDGGKEGSEEQEHRKRRLQKYCTDNRLLLLPGKLDF